MLAELKLLLLSNGSFRLVSGDDQRLSRAQVRQVSVAHATNRRRHVLVGVAIGAAASVVAVGLRCDGQASSCQEVAPAYFYPLAGAGATMGLNGR